METIKRFLVLLLFFLNVFLPVNSQSVVGTWIFTSGNFPVTMLLLDNGTGSQNNDTGYWKTDGETILSVSTSTGKTTRYSLTRQNEQNGDPAIVIGGRKFVTAYRRPSW